MIGSFEMNQPAAYSGDRTGGRSRPAALLPSGVLPWAAFCLLCFWTRSGPASVARTLGAAGFDAGFGLDDRG